VFNVVDKKQYVVDVNKLRNEIMAIEYKPWEKLKQKRIEKGLTQKELADEVGVNTLAISKYEIGYRFPRKNIIYKLAKALDCEVKDLF
jgi:DNA-binding XRE family transcriptional regulator